MGFRNGDVMSSSNRPQAPQLPNVDGHNFDATECQGTGRVWRVVVI